MAISAGPLPYTSLVEPTSNVSAAPPPAPFDPNIAYLLGQCCSLTYAQFDTAAVTTAEFATMSYAGSTVSASNLTAFTVSEADEPGPTTGDVGDYDLVTAGFGVQLAIAPSGGGGARTIVVIALRGSRTWDEWLGDNVDAFPTVFPSPTGSGDGLGSVHSGFFGLYTIGTDGLLSKTPLNPDPAQRAAGSIAAQVAAYVTALDGTLPLFVTGHSLGGALATICALDLASNFTKSYSDLSMYSLAAPRVGAGIADSYGVPIPYYDNQMGLVESYQAYVPNSYRIVHAADIVPILPPASLSFSALTLSCAHVTDAFSTTPSEPAAATATISNGAVTAIAVASSGNRGYNFPPEVSITGGGGSGATAQAIVTAGWTTYYVSAIEVIEGGSGYTSAPTVTLSTSGSLTQNVVSFCAQSGDLGTNHSCTLTYVPYLQALAAGFG